MICPQKVRHLWRRIFYEKKGQIQKRYSEEFKIGIILDMREHQLGYNETIRKYWI